MDPLKITRLLTDRLTADQSQNEFIAFLLLLAVFLLLLLLLLLFALLHWVLVAVVVVDCNNDISLSKC